MALYPTFEVPTATTKSKTTAVFGRAPEFNPAMGDFSLTGAGRIPISDAQQTLTMWCRKALLTPKGLFGYPGGFGADFSHVWDADTQSARETALATTIKACLKADPAHRVTDVSNFSYTWSRDAVHVSCTILTAIGSALKFAINLAEG